MNALPILLLGGAAVMLMAGGKKRKKPTAKVIALDWEGLKATPEITLRVGDTLRIELAEVGGVPYRWKFESEAIAGNPIIAVNEEEIPPVEPMGGAASTLIYNIRADAPGEIEANFVHEHVAVPTEPVGRSARIYIKIIGKGATLPTKPVCPARIEILTPDAEIQKLIAKGWEINPGDIVATANYAFDRIVPTSCAKGDYKTAVKDRLPEIGPGWNVAMLYAWLVYGVIMTFLDAENPKDKEHGMFVIKQINDWYSSLTGDLLPDVD